MKAKEIGENVGKFRGWPYKIFYIAVVHCPRVPNLLQLSVKI